MPDRDDVRVLCALLCPAAPLDLGRRLERAFYRRGWPALKYANDAWENEPRGQPENEGQWVESASGDKRSRKAVRKAVERKQWSMVENAIAKASEADERLREHYRETLRGVFRGISDQGITRLDENVSQYRFYVDVEAATSSYRELTGSEFPEFVEGFFDHENGEVHLNGGYEWSGNWHDDPASSTYAHEIGHALDRGHELSDNKGWQEVWEREILGGALGKAGDINAAEGFATFAEVVLLRRKDAETFFPLCTDYWRKQGLISQEELA